jgi:hypothetical protein
LEEMIMRWRWWGWWLMRDLVARWWWGWWLMMDLVMQWSFMPLLSMAEYIEGVLHLYEPRSLPVDVLPASFNALVCSLPS